MTKIEQMPAANTGKTRTARGPILRSAQPASVRPLSGGSNLLSMPDSRNGIKLVPERTRPRQMGRKGRKALAKRRVVDGAFLCIAMSAAALLWLSSL